ncbi:MAG: DNA-3-methyladenine glycosylase 2 family protein [Ignavibacteriae bacterium]|nr:MAG: DNA-3-methyladenine glycosylase 2 family protein [Ignavibacteriota bacterium]
MKLNEFEESVAVGRKYLSDNDAVLKRIIENIGEFKIKPHKNYFETLVESIVSQQLSLKAAETIFNRFKVLFSSDMNKRFPEPAEIIIMNDIKIRECGFSNAKVKYVKDLSAKVLDDTVQIHKMHKLSDEEIINELVKVKGIGVWTAHMFLMFCLARLNVLPVGDLGLKRAVMINYKLRKFPDEKKVEQISKKNNWSPYNTIASWYLWQSLKSL